MAQKPIPIQCPYCLNQDRTMIEQNTQRNIPLPGSYFCYVCGRDFVVIRVKE